jgi:hypothetical protein
LDLNYPPARPPEFDGIQHERLSIHDVFIQYRRHFGRWFAITAPTSLIAALVLFLKDQQVREIYRNISRSTIQFHMGDIAKADAISCAGYLLAWLLGCFALAAIAAKMNEPAQRDVEAVWIHDAYELARERFGRILVIAIITLAIFLLCAACASFVVFALIRLVGWSHFARFNSIASTAFYITVAGVVSWFGMAIPLVVQGDAGAFQALKKSLKLSNGYEGFLFLLVTESVVGSYVAWYATHYGLALVAPPSLRYTAWYGWAVYVAWILASAAVQPPMFLGFSMLAKVGLSEIPAYEKLFPRPQ